MPDPEVKDPPEKDPPEDKTPDVAEKLLNAIKERMDKKDDSQAPDPQPKQDPKAQWRENKKKEMGWNDAQVDSYQRDIISAQAPLVKDNSLLKLRTNHKDYANLEKAFLSEVEKYEKAGRTIDPTLAEELFYMVKGRELSAGRYKPEAPSSQPNGGDKSVPRGTSRMAPSYNPSDPGNGGAADKKEDAMGQLSEEEQASLAFMDKAASQIGMEVTPEDYVREREQKKKGRREVMESAVRPMEIDLKSANPADRDMAQMWNRSARRRISVR